MNIKKILGSLLILLIVFSVVTCKKKDPAESYVEEPAMIGAIDVPLYQAADGAVELTTLADGTEIICLNRSNPQVRLTGPEGEEDTSPDAPRFYKIRIPESGETGWVKTEHLCFKGEETTAYVLRATYLYGKLNASSANLGWGDTVKVLGYKIEHDWDTYGWVDVELWWVDTGLKQGWIKAVNLLPDVYPAIALEDADLFKLPADRSQNIDGNVQKMETVLVIDKGTDGWVTVRSQEKPDTNSYLSAAKGDPISYKEVDFSLVSYVKEDYYKSRAIVDEVDAAYETSDPDAAVAAITGKKEKIETLSQAAELLEEKLADYPSSSFAPELRLLLRDITEILILLEKAEESSGEEEADPAGEEEIAPMDDPTLTDALSPMDEQ